MEKNQQTPEVPPVEKVEGPQKKQQHVLGEIAGGVIGATGEQNRVHAFGLAAGEEAAAISSQAVTGQEEARAGQVRAVHLNGAVLEIDIEDRMHIVFEVTVAGHEVGQGGVAMTVFGF